MANFYAAMQNQSESSPLARAMLQPSNITKIITMLQNELTDQVTIDELVSNDIKQEIYEALSLSESFSAYDVNAVNALNKWIVMKMIPQLRESVAQSKWFNYRIMSNIRFGDITDRPQLSREPTDVTPVDYIQNNLFAIKQNKCMQAYFESKRNCYFG